MKKKFLIVLVGIGLSFGFLGSAVAGYEACKCLYG